MYDSLTKRYVREQMFCVQLAPMWVPRAVLLKQYPMYLAWYEEKHGKPSQEAVILLLLAQRHGALPLPKDVLLEVLDALW